MLLGACAPAPHDTCATPERTADLPPSLDEASGIAASRSLDNVIWAHNDSEGTAMLYAIDRSGRLLAQMALPHAGTQFDWEDIAVGPCPAGDCIYIADIGDNLHRRDDRAILRLTEPASPATPTSAIERFPIRYPDGPEDAEAMFITPDTVVYIVTKGRSRAITLYRYPPPLRADERVTLEIVQRLSDGIVQLPDLVTGADASPDGSRVAIRTYTRLRLFRFDDTLSATLPPPGIDLLPLAEPQGEAVAFLGGDTLLLATESGPERTQPFLSRVACTIR